MGKDRAIDFGATDEHVAAAQQLVDGIRSAPEDDVLMYRSVSFDADSNSPLKAALDSAQPGQTISLDRISSFSTDQAHAAYYAGDGTHNYELRVEGASKSLATDPLTGMGHQERLTQGQFEITQVLKSSEVTRPEAYGGTTRYTSTVVLRQRKVF